MRSPNRGKTRAGNLNRRLAFRLGMLLIVFPVLLAVSYLFTLGATSEKQYDSVLANLAGRQRMLIQKYTSEVLYIIGERAEGSATDEAHGAVSAEKTAQVFETTHRAFLQGGKTPVGVRWGPSTKKVAIPRTANAEVRKQLGVLGRHWKALRGIAADALKPGVSKRASADYTLRLLAQADKTSAEMDHVVTLMQHASEARLARVGALQVGFLGAGAILFFVALGFAYRKIIKPLDRSTTTLERHNQQLARRTANREVLNTLLRLALKAATRDEFMNRSLDALISHDLVNEGCGIRLFLVEEEPAVLALMTEKGIDEPTHADSSRVPFGKSLVGRAAAEGALLSSTDVADCERGRAECANRSARQYALPLFRDAEVIGVLQLWVLPGREHREELEAFLVAVADVLSVGLHRFEIQKDLRDSEMRLSSITSAARDAIVVLDDRGHVAFWNHGAEEMFGFSKDELVGKDFHDFCVPPEARERFKTAFPAFRETGRGPIINTIQEITAQRKGGDAFPAEVSISAFMINGRWHAVGIVRDITERRDTQQQLQRTTRELRERVTQQETLFAAANLIHHPTLPLEAMYEGLVNLLPQAWDCPGEVAVRMEIDERIFAGEGYRATRRTVSQPLILRGERIGTIHVSCAQNEVPADPNWDEDKARRILEDVATRLTMVIEHRRFENQLVRTEKLASLGELLAGVAHELNNPLTGVIGFAHLALGSKNLDDKVRRDLEKLEHEAGRCADVVKHLLTIAHQEESPKDRISLKQTLDSALEILEYELRAENIVFTTNFQDDLPKVDAVGPRLQQVVVNMVTNAQQAMEGWAGEKKLSVEGYQEPSGAIALRVSDSGPGMTAEVKRRAFDPFFTTKPVGQGTGLGLSLCHSIVESWGGTIQLDSAPGQGTTFTIRFPGPAAREKTKEIVETPTDLPEDAPAGDRYALVIDDEPLVGDVLASLLEELDFTVDIAPDGREGCRRIRERDYDLVLCDVRMPNMGGEEFYHHVRATMPQLLDRLVFTTGDAVRQSTLRFLNETGARVLAKPFRQEALEKMARTVSRDLAGAVGVKGDT